MQRILITGASGLLGAAVQERLATAGHAVIPCHHSRPRHDGEALDITDLESVADVFDRIRPELVVHCAALADAGCCEDDPDRAWLVNATGTELVADQSARHGARLVHVSTDWVFPGTGQGGYHENDPPEPLQVYGRTKLAAERAAAGLVSSLVVRMPLLYDLEPWPRATWPTQTLDRFICGAEVLADDVEVRQPAMAADVAACIVALIGLGASGVVHIAPAQTCTKFGWSRLLASIVGLPEELVRPAPRPDRPTRPLRATLRTDRLTELGVPPPRGVSEVASAGRTLLARRLSAGSERAEP